MSADVVALGAWCDLDADARTSPGDASFVVHEFAVLADGRRLTLHTERGFTTGVRTVGRAEPVDPWAHLTVEELTADVLTTVLPDDDDGEEHPWEWLAGLLRRHGVEASVERLKAVPYTVEFGERLAERLRVRDA